jgi:hypothetical protein
MSCCRCHCSPCSCNVTEVRTPAPEARVYHFNDGTCCPIKGWYETLNLASWTPPASGASTIIAVCDATQYPVGTCVKVSDGSNTAVLKVTGWNKDKDAIYVLGYDNAENTGGTLSGLINSFPLAICPVETQEGGVVCDRDYMVTAEAFVQPTAITSGGGTVKIVFDRPQTLQLGMSIYVVGAGYMEVSVPPSGTFVACGTEFYVYNLGAASNTGAGVTVPSGAAAYPDPVPSASAATATTPSAGDLPEFRHAYAETPAQQTVSSPGTDNVIYAEIAVSENEVVEVYGQMLTFSPQLSIAFTLLSGSGAKLGNSTPGQTRTYEDDGSNGGIPRLPAYSSTHREFWKATANTTLRFAWTWSTGPYAPATCAAVIAQRYIELRVVGVMP